MRREEDRMTLYARLCASCSRATTRLYSTSFSWSVRTLAPEMRPDIHAIYGFVRLADEIVDSFHGHDRRLLLKRFRAETDQALEDRFSLNPILHSFQATYHRWGIERIHVDQFLQSMAWDLDRTDYDREGFETYVLGSAEVVGLMCLKVFVRGDEEVYRRLRPAAVRLGAAFQKVNFLRDMREDFGELGRSYFPDLDPLSFDDQAKARIEAEIEEDLRVAFAGIVQLPREARFGVLLAYTYYRQLLRRIQRVPSRAVMAGRIRVPDHEKAFLLVTTWARHRMDSIGS